MKSSMEPNWCALHYAAVGTKKDPNGPMAERAQRLRKALGYDFHGGQKAFAEKLGLNPDLWNHYEKGFNISDSSARRVEQVFPGVHPGWLKWGDPRFLTLDMAQLLGEVPAVRKGKTEAPSKGS